MNRGSLGLVLALSISSVALCDAAAALHAGRAPSSPLWVHSMSHMFNLAARLRLHNL